MVRTESALVHVARAESGSRPSPTRAAVAAPRGGRAARGCAAGLGCFPFFRAFVAMEFDAAGARRRAASTLRGDLEATRCSSIALVPVAAITAVGHLVAILTSERLR